MRKHPAWTENRLRQAAIVAEEGGEVLQAALSIVEYEEQVATKGHATAYDVTLDHNNLEKLEEDLIAEAAQTGAMALRFLMNYAPLYAKTRPQSSS